MIASTPPPSAAAWMTWARWGWWAEKPMNFALPELRILSATSRNSGLLMNLTDPSIPHRLSPSPWMKKKSM